MQRERDEHAAAARALHDRLLLAPRPEDKAGSEALVATMASDASPASPLRLVRQKLLLAGRGTARV